MRHKTKRIGARALLCLAAGAWSIYAQCAATAELLPRAEWPAVPTGAAVVQIPSLQRVMLRFQGMADGVIIVRYPGGDLGNAWAAELREWLVALGVSYARVILEPGSGIPDTIVLIADERPR